MDHRVDGQRDESPGSSGKSSPTKRAGLWSLKEMLATFCWRNKVFFFFSGGGVIEKMCKIAEKTVLGYYLLSTRSKVLERIRSQALTQPFLIACSLPVSISKTLRMPRYAEMHLDNATDHEFPETNKGSRNAVQSIQTLNISICVFPQLWLYIDYKCSCLTFDTCDCSFCFWRVRPNIDNE